MEMAGCHHSQGFCYEAAAIARCIAAGLLECPQWSQTESVNCLKISEAWLAEINGDEHVDAKQPRLYHTVAVALHTEAAEDAEDFTNAIMSLKHSCAPLVLEAGGGLNVSSEGKDKGLTHTFVMSFASEANRDAYLAHPAHEAFGKKFGHLVRDVFVSDHWQ